MPPVRTRFSLFHAILAIGVALCGYYGHAWWTLPDYSEADIEASVELNLAMDLSRRGPHLQPDAARLEQLRSQVRAEIEGSLRQQVETIQLRFGIGLLCLVIGLSHVLTRQFSGADKPPSH